MKGGFMIRILLVTALVISGNAFSESVQISTVQIAKDDLVKSVEALAEQEVECKEQAKKLPVDEIKNTGVSKSELKVALAYFYMKSRMECVQNASFSVVAKMAVLDYFQPETQVESKSASKLIVLDFAKLVELKSEYMSLNKATRSKLEKITELNKPFDMVGSLDDLGL